MRFLRTDNDVAALLMRLALGVVFVAHGAQKVLGWWGGYGANATIQGVREDGMPPLLTILVMAAELGEGWLLIVGFPTRLAALGIGCVMLGAVVLVHSKVGFFMNWAGSQKGEASSTTSSRSPRDSTSHQSGGADVRRRSARRPRRPRRVSGIADHVATNRGGGSRQRVLTFLAASLGCARRPSRPVKGRPWHRIPLCFVGWKLPSWGGRRTRWSCSDRSSVFLTKAGNCGTIDFVRAVPALAHGGDLDGFILVRGERSKLSALRHSRNSRSSSPGA